MLLNVAFCFLLFFFPVEGALAHPYLASLHDISDEPVCSMPFSFDFEQHALSEEQMKDLIYQEALAFNPDYQ
jgi:mitogen-activated protein kinase 6